ncbi:unnamed protein product [Hydatigera taeniaeformis]|uniref:ANK_REP_REGION domain-containing protein n=1 Tax=Hydatigena taeniaeformis TaxID=6205 RepID=A0A0R3X2D2_HYDTA|nr:unnamed protein product [Hydatigera taeniaeformis]
MKKLDVAELYPPFPYISVPDFHTVKIDWYECLEELEEQGMNVAMEQIAQIFVIVPFLLLLFSNAKIEFTDQMDYTPLMAAVSRNNKVIIRILLSYGANVNTANKLGRTALMLASNKGYIDIVDILIKKGANVNARDIHGMTALFYAVDGEFSNVVRALVRAGADVNHCESDNGYTPLIRLACLANNGNPKVGDTLIECGAKVNQQDKFGQTALIHCAFHRNHADLAKVLLQHGADLSIRNNVKEKKNTAADIAKSLDNTVSLICIGLFIYLMFGFLEFSPSCKFAQEKRVNFDCWFPLR